MNIKKPLTTAILSGGLVLGSFGAATMASAQYGGEEPSTDTDVSADVDVDAEAGAVAVQLEDDADTENADNDNEGRSGRRSQKRETIADAIGISVEELQDARQDGQSFAEIAEANGSTSEAVVDAIISNIEERLDTKVADGDLTEEEAAEKLANKVERIEAKVDAEPGERGNRGQRNNNDADDAQVEEDAV